MILTFTPNPSVDRTIFVDALSRGSVMRSRRSRNEPSGKGVNVALALQRQGVAVAAVFPTGGSSGAQLCEMLNARKLDTRTVPMNGEVRTNVSLVEPDGTVTKVNEPGPELTAAEVEELVATIRRSLDGVTWLACCGSLPGGAPVDLYARVAKLARSRGVRVAVDSSSDALYGSLGGRPHLIKPNVHELSELVGQPLRRLGDVEEAAHQLRRQGVPVVLVTLGADGALLVDASGVAHAEASVERVASAVGAGDAALAGYLSVREAGIPGLQAAVAWGSAAVQHEGTLFEFTNIVLPVTVTRVIDRSRVLRDTADPPRVR
jgi:1-phosphofructokinase